MARRKTHPGTIQERGNSFRVRIQVGNERHAFTLRNVGQREAEAFAREKHQELSQAAKRRTDGLPSLVPMSSLLERFNADYMPTLAPGTRASYRDSLKPIRVFFLDILGDLPLEKIHARHIQQYLTWRRTRTPKGEPRTQPLTNRTLAKDRAVLHRLLGLADRLELREGNPVTKVEPPKAKERDPVILKPDEYERLLEACAEVSPMLHLYALTLGETGARCVSEALWVRWEDVDLEYGFLWVDSSSHGRKTKSDRGRWVPMTRRLREAVQDHFAQFRMAVYHGERSPWVFHHIKDAKTHTAGTRIRRKLRTQFREVCSTIKLPEGFVAHDLRHRRATTWIGDGKNPVHVKEALGHSDLRVTMRYTHLAREHLRSLVEETDERAGLRELAR
ncbi:tyrosine-type recombinase/integrase [Gemmatimonadota bacterium]